MSIRLLSPAIINRIAAGEVVERPSSAVKELVENSIDAGSTRIDIVIEQGGRNLIQVTDDGSGMSKDELELSIERHATSKLSDDDLFNINSFGFRGEALPSIGSISRMTITSKAEGADAWSIRVEGGEKSSLSPASINKGTKIEIRDLFFATPARLKFLKTERTEQQHISDTLKQIAMSHPQIAFSLTADGKKTLDLISQRDESTGSYLNRIGDILGRDFIDNALEVDAEREGAHLTGFASLPTFNRGKSTAQYLFVNGRPVKDRLIIGAIRGAYQDFLARDRHPVVVLFLDIPNELVDVNVHPAKSEVRFRDAGSVRGLIVGSLRNALSNAGHKASTTVAHTALGSFTPQDNVAPFNPSRGFYDRPNPAYRDASANVTNQMPLEMQAQPMARAEEPQVESDYENHPLGAARCQLHKTYIVSQTKDGLILVDQHAAHERLVYERMKEAIAAEGMKTQKLLIPEVIELDEVAVENFEKRKEEFHKMGFAFEKFSDKAIVVNETPALLGELNTKQLVNDLADDLEEFGEATTLKEKLEHVCGTIACHGSVRSGRRLNSHEMNAILREMEETPYSGQCNHGRPTYVELKLHEIEKLFGRK